jgi:hypothetical protein
MDELYHQNRDRSYLNKNSLQNEITKLHEVRERLTDRSDLQDMHEMDERYMPTASAIY